MKYFGKGDNSRIIDFENFYWIMQADYVQLKSIDLYDYYWIDLICNVELNFKNWGFIILFNFEIIILYKLLYDKL